MIIVGVPYTESGLTYMDDITGGTLYGASALAGGDGSRQPTANELKIARFQGRRVVGSVSLSEFSKTLIGRSHPEIRFVF